MGMYRSSTFGRGMGYIKRNLKNYGMIFGDGSDAYLDTSGSVTFSISSGDKVTKQYKNLTINAGHIMGVNNPADGIFIFVQDVLTIENTGVISGENKGYDRQDGNNLLLTTSLNRSSLRSAKNILEIANPLNFYKAYDTSYPIANAVASTYGMIGGRGGDGGKGGDYWCIPGELWDYGASGGSDSTGGPYSGGFAGGGGEGSATDTTQTAGGAGGNTSSGAGGNGSGSGGCYGGNGGTIPGCGVFIFARRVVLKSGSILYARSTNNGSAGENAYSAPWYWCGGGGGGGLGGGPISVSALESILNSGTINSNGSSGGAAGTGGGSTATDIGYAGVAGQSGVAGTQNTNNRIGLA